MRRNRERHGGIYLHRNRKTHTRKQHGTHAVSNGKRHTTHCSATETHVVSSIKRNKTATETHTPTHTHAETDGASKRRQWDVSENFA